MTQTTACSLQKTDLFSPCFLKAGNDRYPTGFNYKISSLV